MHEVQQQSQRTRNQRFKNKHKQQMKLLESVFFHIVRI